MYRNNDSLKFSVNELMKGILDPGFEWTELVIKQGAVVDEAPAVDADQSAMPAPAPAPSAPLQAEDYPVVPEKFLQYCEPPKYGIFSLYGKTRMNFNISTLCM